MASFDVYDKQKIDELLELTAQAAGGGYATSSGRSVSGITTLDSGCYYNVTGAAQLMLPAAFVAANKPAPFRVLVHLADGVSSGDVSFVDPNGRTIVTNNSTNAYRVSIPGGSVGLSNAWKLITARVFLNPQGNEIVYLEV